MNHYSPLRYPGGKAKFSTYIKAIIESNNLLDCIYVEPFCGGSAVALSLLLEGYARKIIINDFDLVIYAFWDSVINNTEELIRLINDTPLSIQTWEKAKKIHKNLDAYSNIEIGFATFLLNRVNRSGILKAGIIGGKSQTGTWKMDARYNKIDLISRIQAIAQKKSRIEVMNKDAVDCLKELENRALSKTFVYLDPPYYHKGPELYLNFFNHEDHVRIASYVEKMNFTPWLISYDNCKEITDIYSFTTPQFYELNYSAGSIRGKGQEVLFSSNQITIPLIENNSEVLEFNNVL
jgi:DNA adenine methylase